jgi:hypothetical protein
VVVVLAAWDGFFHSDGVNLHFDVRVDTELEGLWWIRVIGLYNNTDVSVRFDNSTGKAAVPPLDSGSYQVIIASSDGFRCTQEVDVWHTTKQWIVSPSTCTFHLDEWAHVVTPEEKANGRRGPWYDSIERARREHREALRKLTEKP